VLTEEVNSIVIGLIWSDSCNWSISSCVIKGRPITGIDSSELMFS